MQTTWLVEDDQELPRRSMIYLIKNGITPREAVEMVAQEFELDEAARRMLLAA